MSEYELTNLYCVCAEALTTYIMNFITILSGYLLASHYLGNKLNTLQFWIMTMVYALAIGVTVGATYTKMTEMIIIEDLITAMDGFLTPTIGTVYQYRLVVSSAYLLAFIGSIYFAFKSRSRMESKA